ncbi:MAG: HAMP domain-containing histidine kinase [Bacteroidetes bacterium]|nr:HAMP domain-containing histidine kinase [Bacteroidota bacterium]
MNKKLFITLVILMSLALLGIIGMQYFWFRNSIRVKQAELKLNVNEALRNTALKLENRETLQKLLSSLNNADSASSIKSDKTKAHIETANAKRRKQNPKIKSGTKILDEDVMLNRISYDNNGSPIPVESRFVPKPDDFMKFNFSFDSANIAADIHGKLKELNALQQKRHTVVLRKKGLPLRTDSIRLGTKTNTHQVTVSVSSNSSPQMHFIYNGKDKEPNFNEIFIELRKLMKSKDAEKLSKKLDDDFAPIQIVQELGKHPDSVFRTRIDSVMRKVKPFQGIRYPDRKEMQEMEARVIANARNRKMPPFNFGFPFAPQPSMVHTVKIQTTERDTLVQKRIKHLNGIIDQIILEVSTNHSLLNKRLNLKLIDSVLVNELKNNGISMKPEYAIFNDLIGKVSSIHSPGYNVKASPDYSTRLFPNDLFGSPYSLKVQFVNRDKYVLRSMSLMLSMSILLTAFLVFAFVFALWAILNQKKISEIKSDFINNITHEFKTPISTIGLAIDSIDNPKIISNQGQIRYFTQIIREENHRMNQLVENVLRTALLDRKVLKQHLVEIDFHELILKAVSHSHLQIESRNGYIDLKLEAPNAIIEADATQVLNALINLIDNAIKYSKDKPEITISTRQSGYNIICSIEDNGIGMTREVQRRIFDRFYRYTEGNIHDVKGHGLGLSFVKTIIEAHNGRVSVESEPGKGSRFELLIPLKSDKNEE